MTFREKLRSFIAALILAAGLLSTMVLAWVSLLGVIPEGRRTAITLVGIVSGMYVLVGTIALHDIKEKSE